MTFFVRAVKEKFQDVFDDNVLPGNWWPAFHLLSSQGTTYLNRQPTKPLQRAVTLERSFVTFGEQKCYIKLVRKFAKKVVD